MPPTIKMKKLKRKQRDKQDELSNSNILSKHSTPNTQQLYTQLDERKLLYIFYILYRNAPQCGELLSAPF